MVKHDFSTYDITGRWGFDMKNSITHAKLELSTTAAAPSRDHS
jgi:hypothetical protein